MIGLIFILICLLSFVASLRKRYVFSLATKYKRHCTIILLLCTQYSILTAQTTTVPAYAINLTSSYSNPCCNNLVATFTLTMRTYNAPSTATVDTWVINKEAGPYSYYWSDGYSVTNTMDTVVIHTTQTPFTVTITTCCTSYIRYNYSFLCPNTWAPDNSYLNEVNVTLEKAQCETMGSLLHINHALYIAVFNCPNPNDCLPKPTFLTNYVLMEGSKMIYEGAMPNTISNVSVGTHTYTLFDKSNNECGFDFIVAVEPDYSSSIYLPNAFSPNGDGNNDVFCIQNELGCIDECSMSIFDKWGEKVFESHHISNCWDGRFKNKLLDSDVYVYYAKAKLVSGKEIIKKGNVTLIR